MITPNSYKVGRASIQVCEHQTAARQAELLYRYVNTKQQQGGQSFYTGM